MTTADDHRVDPNVWYKLRERFRRRGTITQAELRTFIRAAAYWVRSFRECGDRDNAERYERLTKRMIIAVQRAWAEPRTRYDVAVDGEEVSWHREQKEKTRKHVRSADRTSEILERALL